MFLWDDTIQPLIKFEEKKVYTTVGTSKKLISISKELCNILGYSIDQLSKSPIKAYPSPDDRSFLFSLARKQELIATQLFQTNSKRPIKAVLQIKYNPIENIYTANIQIDPFCNHKNSTRITVDKTKQIIFVHENNHSSYKDFQEGFQTLYALSYQMIDPIVIFIKDNSTELDYITMNEAARGYCFFKKFEKTSGPMNLTAAIRVVDKKAFSTVQFISVINGGLHALYAPTVNDAVQIADTIHKSNINHHSLKEICIMG